MRTPEIPPATGRNARDDSDRSGATLSTDEIRERIINGRINREDLTVRQREIYAEELKKARKY